MLGVPFFDVHIAPLLCRMWEVVVSRFPDQARAMHVSLLADDGTDYGLCGTGWSKVTISENNPTCAHVRPACSRPLPTACHAVTQARQTELSARAPPQVDHNNCFVTALLALPVPGSEPLQGGDHVLFSEDMASAVVVETPADGSVLILGPYDRVLHANCGTCTVRGRRFVVNAYCGAKVVQRISGIPCVRGEAPSDDT